MWVKKYFFPGLVILLPLAFTLFVIIFTIDLFTNPFLRSATLLLKQFPHLFTFLERYELLYPITRLFVLVALVLFLILLGMVAQRFFFHTLLEKAHQLLYKTPVIRSIYKTSREVISALLVRDKDKKAFDRPVMIPFPSLSSYGIGFISGKIPSACEQKLGNRVIPVFIPTAPHPISGYFMFIEEKHVHPVDMSNEEALKFIVSCGLILPESPKNSPE